jgi:pilus assembly protein CpaE
MPILLTADAAAEQALTFGIGPGTSVVDSFPELERKIAKSKAAVTLVVVGPDMALDETVHFSDRLREHHPEIGVVLVRRRLDTGLLVQAMRAGVRDVVKYDDLGALSDACRRSEEVTLRLLGEGRPAERGTSQLSGQILTVFSGKGGSGKTTLATNSAVALATAGHKVCLVDLDLMFGDVAIALQLVPDRSLADAVALAGKLDQLGVESLVTKHSSGAEAVLAPVSPGTADTVSADVVSELLTVARKMYDVVVVDTPPAFTDHVLAAFDQTDAFLLLCALDVPSIKNLKLTVETMELLRYPRDRWHLVVNRADSRVGLSVSDVERAVGLKSMAEIPSDRAVPASLNRGVPIVTEHPKHAVSTAIRRMATSVLQPAPPESVPPEPTETGKHARVERTKLAMLRRGGKT